MTIDEMRANPEAARRLVAMSGCPLRDQAIALKAIDGETYSAIGKSFGLSAGRVGSIVARCISDAEMRALRVVTGRYGMKDGTDVRQSGLSVRISHSLVNVGVFTLEHLREVIDREGADFLDRLPNIGPKAKREILDRLAVMPA